jgi:predicted nucleic acid-binding protein
VIFDINVLIYLSKHTLTPERVLKGQIAISIITKIEVLGFRFHNTDEHQLLLSLCNELKIIPLSNLIAEETILVRQHHVLNYLML